MGENVPYAKRGRFAIVHGSIVKRFNPFHLTIATGNADDLSEAAIIEKVTVWFILITNIKRVNNKIGVDLFYGS